MAPVSTSFTYQFYFSNNLIWLDIFLLIWARMQESDPRIIKTSIDFAWFEWWHALKCSCLLVLWLCYKLMVVFESISTPLFSKMITFFKNRASWYSFCCNSTPHHGGRFWKNVLIFEKKTRCWFLVLVCMVYGQNLPYKFKKSYDDIQNRNIEKSHRTTGPWSDLRPDSWSSANSGLDTTSRIFENRSFWVATRAS